MAIRRSCAILCDLVLYLVICAPFGVILPLAEASRGCPTAHGRSNPVKPVKPVRRQTAVTVPGPPVNPSNRYTRFIVRCVRPRGALRDTACSPASSSPLLISASDTSRLTYASISSACRRAARALRQTCQYTVRAPGPLSKRVKGRARPGPSVKTRQRSSAPRALRQSRQSRQMAVKIQTHLGPLPSPPGLYAPCTRCPAPGAVEPGHGKMGQVSRAMTLQKREHAGL